MRICARLDEEQSKRLEFLRRETQASVSEVIKRSIDRYYEEVAQGHSLAAEIFESTGFIGSGEGPGDLSTEYKRYLEEGWSSKQGGH